MKGRVILIDMPEERADQAALLVDGRLEDLLLDPPDGDTTPAPDEIYWAKVDRLVPKMGGAFVKLTPEHRGFLREAKGLREGDQLPTYVSVFAEPGKAIPVSRHLLFKSRWLILTPGRPGVNVSRSIRDPQERERLSKCVAEPDENCGIIVRTAARGVEEEMLRKVAKAATSGMRITPEVGKIFAEHSKRIWGGGAVLSAVREWTDPTPDEIVYAGDGQPDIEEAAWVFREYPDLDAVATLFDGPDLFDHYGVWDEIERLKSPRAELPSGAWMAVEATRAMVTVDVNTGGEFGGGAALTANLEAARELPRQLRLRGLGGQVIIDFAPLPKKDRKRIEAALKAAFRRDPVETSLAGWTPLGNFELQRKRERRPLSELLA
ncbi:MAG: ribonuclease E/G [Proteobacteria bacterium]|nr:ribonuclease E/G [Pseudomonadota bacterium]